MQPEIIEQLKIITEEEQHIIAGKTEIDKSLYQSADTTDDDLIDAKKLLDAGKLITIRPNTRFVHFPPHRHNYVEVMYMCCGQTRHIINGNEVVLQQGELLFLNQNSIQEIMPAGENDIGVNFIILPEFFDHALGMMEAEESPLRDFLINCLRAENTEASYFHFKVADVLPIQNLVENLIWTLMNHQVNKRSVNEITMGLLLLHLMGHMDSVETDQQSQGEMLTMQVLSYIESHYRNGELTELAELLHYDVYWLSREIKNNTGSTYTELVQAKRLSQATYLLTHTAMSVSDVGAAVGYENMSYFHKIFQKKYGCTPRKYRVEHSLSTV